MVCASNVPQDRPDRGFGMATVPCINRIDKHPVCLSSLETWTAGGTILENEAVNDGIIICRFGYPQLTLRQGRMPLIRNMGMLSLRAPPRWQRNCDLECLYIIVLQNNIEDTRRLASYIVNWIEIHGTRHCMLNNKMEMRSTSCGSRQLTGLTCKGTGICR